MRLKFLLQSGLLLGIFFFTVSAVSAAEEPEDKFLKLIQTEPTIEYSDSPLQSQYIRTEKEVRDFVPKQTILEMQRLLAHDRQEKLTTLTDEALAPLLSAGCLPVSSGGAGGIQNVTQGINTSTHYEEKCNEIRSLNERFSQKISSIRYQNIFSDGDAKNSGFDLLEDIAQLKERVDGDQQEELPGWTRDISPDAKYLTGDWFKPEYVQASAESLADTMKKFSFQNTDPNNLGFCPLPGAAPTTPLATTPPTFSDGEKEAIVKSFARFERAKTTPDPSFDNEAVLKKDSSGFLTNELAALGNLQAGIQALDKWNCLLDSFCIKLHFQTSFASEATTTGGFGIPSLRNSLEKLSNATDELSAQNLQLKNEPRTIFSFGWQDLKFEVPSNLIQIDFIPIIPTVEDDVFISDKIISQLKASWQAVTKSGNASQTTVPTNASSGSFAAQAATTLAKQEETKELAVKLQTQQILQKNLSDYQTVIGSQLDHFGEELQALLTQMEALKKISKNFASTKVQHN